MYGEAAGDRFKTSRSYRALAHNKQLLAINISPLQGEAAISKLLHEVNSRFDLLVMKGK
jgi:hypothetical protein